MTVRWQTKEDGSVEYKKGKPVEEMTEEEIVAEVTEKLSALNRVRADWFAMYVPKGARIQTNE